MLQSFLNSIADTYKRIKSKLFGKQRFIDTINDAIIMATKYLPSMLKDLEAYSNLDLSWWKKIIFDSGTPELKVFISRLENHTKGKSKKKFAYIEQAVVNCAVYMTLLLEVVEREFDKTTNEASLDTMNYRLGHIVTEIGAIRTWFDELGLLHTLISGGVERTTTSTIGGGHVVSKTERYRVSVNNELLLTMADKYQEDPKRLIDKVMKIEPVQVTKDVANLINGKTISETNQMGFVASKINPLFLLGMVYNDIYLWNLEIMKHRYERAQIQRTLINQMMRDKKLANRDISTLSESEKRELEKLKKQIEFYDIAIAKLERQIREKMEEA